MQLEREDNVDLFLSLVKDMLICEGGQLLGFRATARLLKNLDKQVQSPPSTLVDGETSEVEKSFHG